MITNVSLEQYLHETQIPLRLSCISDSGWPVVLSLWYLFEEGDLYCATSQEAKVVSYLMEEPRCAFEIASDLPPYCGVRGQALATIEQERGVEILERLLKRYLGGTDNDLARLLLGRSVPEVAIRLRPSSFHTWNFSERMADSIPDGVQKSCPD
jgi:nitroimidazol reductase NimA-like FMN-containing flavoprotein (pyridoxamine 5'-phosphate oxidase superfamily)